MICTFGNPLSEEDMITALDGEASPEIIEHLRRCPYCQRQLEVRTLLEERLQQVSHPSAQLLLEYQFNMVTPREADAIGNHLDRCTQCRVILAEYAAESASPVPEKIRFSVLEAPKPIFPKRLRDIAVRLNAPSTLAPTVLGDNEGAQIVAGAPGISLFLSIEMRDDGLYDIHGQVVADDQILWHNAAAAVSQGEHIITMSLLNDLGQFVCESLAPETYRLRIRAIAGETLVFDPLNIP